MMEIREKKIERFPRFFGKNMAILENVNNFNISGKDDVRHLREERTLAVPTAGESEK